jgi:hypothetical protein
MTVSASADVQTNGADLWEPSKQEGRLCARRSNLHNSCGKCGFMVGRGLRMSVSNVVADAYVNKTKCVVHGGGELLKRLCFPHAPQRPVNVRHARVMYINTTTQIMLIIKHHNTNDADYTTQQYYRI